MFRDAAILAGIVLGLAAVSAAEAPKADPRVTPGAPFELVLPDLPETRRGKPARIRVRVPKNYSLSRVYPLVVWMHGGDGGVGLRTGLADPERFVHAALPYPKGADNPRQKNMVGDFPAMWQYHVQLLQELHRAVPNISPALRVLAGFSNGGHAIDGFLTLRTAGGGPSPLGRFFNVFILADGGMGWGDYRALRGKHLFVCWGEKGRTNKRNCMRLAAKARAAGVHVRAVPMADVGHAFPKTYEQQARAWLEDQVPWALLNQAEVELRRLSAEGRLDEASLLLNQLHAVTEDPVRLGLLQQILER